MIGDMLLFCRVIDWKSIGDDRTISSNVIDSEPSFRNKLNAKRLGLVLSGMSPPVATDVVTLLAKATPLTSVIASSWMYKTVVASLVAILVEDLISSRSSNTNPISIDVLSSDAYVTSPDDN